MITAMIAVGTALALNRGIAVKTLDAAATEQRRDRLEHHVAVLAGAIGERNLMHYGNLDLAADYIAGEMSRTGIAPEEQAYRVRAGALRRKWRQYHYENQTYRNLILEIPGRSAPDEIVVIGAHYDSAPVPGCRAANDNASGVAAVLELAREFAAQPQDKTLRFVAFANEEPPFFWTRNMGSAVYARSCRDNKEKIVAMLSLETIGCYSEQPGSQRYPLPLLSRFFPDRGNFIAFVADSGAKKLQRQCLTAFRRAAVFPAEGAALPWIIPRIGSSDHFPFRRRHYPALMVTDTAPYRDRTYHTNRDNPDHLNYRCMARVVNGLSAVIVDLAN
ncbi:MAG: M28 family peptidase [Victivallales bacterium]|nr:M28 family peptidase [Victivallales bacterium]